MVTRLCLVGAGSIGRRHLRLLLERQDVTLCVVEPNEVCRAAVAQEHPQIHDLQIVGDKGYILGDFMSADVTVGSRFGAEMSPGKQIKRPGLSGLAALLWGSFRRCGNKRFTVKLWYATM